MHSLNVWNTCSPKEFILGEWCSIKSFSFSSLIKKAIVSKIEEGKVCLIAWGQREKTPKLV